MTALETSDPPPITDKGQRRVVEHNTLLMAKGGGITFVGKLFTYANRLVITVILARLLGASEYGLYNLALSVLTVAAGLSMFGLDAAVVRYVAIFARRRDEAGVWGMLQVALGVTSLLSLLLAAGLFIAADIIALRVFQAPQLAPVLRVASAIVPFLALNNIVAAATQGFKQMQYATIARDILQPLLRLALVLLLALIGLNASVAVAIFGIAVATTSVLLLFFLHRLFRLRRPLQQGRRDLREILGFALPVFLSDLMTTFRENIQTMLLGSLYTVASVGVFAVANQLNMVGSMFQSAIATASRPLASELYDAGDYEQMGQVYQTTTKWTFTVNLPLFLVMLLFPATILSLFGKSFVAGAVALSLLASAIMVDISTGMCGIILDMTGHTTLKLINSIVRLVMSLGLSILLIPQWGVVGAALATLLVVATVNVLRLLQVFVLFRLLPYNLSFFKPITAGLAAVATVAACGIVLSGIATPWREMLQIGMLFGVYVVVLLSLGLSPEDRIVLARARHRLDPRLSRSARHDH